MGSQPRGLICPHQLFPALSSKVSGDLLPFILTSWGSSIPLQRELFLPQQRA